MAGIGVISFAIRQICRTGIDVGSLVVAKAFPREGAILAPGSIEDRNVRYDLLLLDQPVEHRRRTVGRVAGAPLWPDASDLVLLASSDLVPKLQL